MKWFLRARRAVLRFLMRGDMVVAEGMVYGSIIIFVGAVTGLITIGPGFFFPTLLLAASTFATGVAELKAAEDKRENEDPAEKIARSIIKELKQR